MEVPSELLAGLQQRSATYRRNERLDALLGELQALLAPAERAVIASLPSGGLHAPALLVVGNPRSGTTLLMQCLNATGWFAVPSNLLSRFYYAPSIGARIQRLLFDPAFAYKEELADLQPAPTQLTSELGKTRGALAPSEFFHFWRRFLPNYDPEFLDAEACRQIDSQGLRDGVAAIEASFERPFAAKAIILQYNLAALAQALQKVIFIHLRRHPFFVMQSILEAREAFYGNRTRWWSVKPREYAQLKALGPYEQIAGQVWHTGQSLLEQSRAFPAAQWLDLDYTAFCADPRSALERVAQAYRSAGVELPPAGPIPGNLSPNDTVRLPARDVEGLLTAYAGFSGQPLSLA